MAVLGLGSHANEPLVVRFADRNVGDDPPDAGGPEVLRDRGLLKVERIVGGDRRRRQDRDRRRRHDSSALPVHTHAHGAHLDLVGFFGDVDLVAEVFAWDNQPAGVEDIEVLGGFGRGR
jgi:hypothetical protein